MRLPALLALLLALAAPTPPALADGATPATAEASYRLQPGDVLQIAVWKEEELEAETLIRPDGALSFPLTGEVAAAGRPVEELREDLEARIRKFIPDAVVTVAVKATVGNRVYVLGKVARPGDFVLSRPTDVMQALSLAGGTTPFADVDAIRVLRRDGAVQRAIPFRYGDVERGRNLEQNIVLRGGDTVVVP